MHSEAVANRVDVFRRGPKAIYSRKKQGSEPEQAVSKNVAASEAEPDHTNSIVNLRSTLELFGSASFKLESYLERHIGHAKNENAHKQELANRKALLSGALKTFVTDHYQMFIHTSQEIENIESDLSELHSSLSQYKISLKMLQDVSMCENVSTEADENFANITSQKKKQQSYVGFVNELVEELNMLRYERKLEQATTVLESAFKRLEVETEDAEVVKNVLYSERDKVIDLSIEMFQNQLMKPNERRCYLNYVVRLGCLDKALKLFFDQRSVLMRTAQSQIRSSGDVTSFITDMSGIVFSSIGHGWVEFKRVFRDHTRDSSFFTWALNELIGFCSIVRAQVFHTDTPFRTSCQCVHLTILACKMLEKQGIKLSFILDTFFLDDLRTALRQYLSNARQTITKAVREERWVAESAWIKQAANIDAADKVAGKLDITKSARVLYDVVHQYIIDMKLVVLNPGLFDPTVNDLLPIAVNGVRMLFEEYLVQMATASKAPDTTEKQSAAMISNSRNLAEDLYPRLIKQLGPRLQKQRGLEDIIAFHEQVKKFYRAQTDYFSQRRSSTVTQESNKG